MATMSAGGDDDDLDVEWMGRKMVIWRWSDSNVLIKQFVTNLCDCFNRVGLI
jgi:hypothetical protein